MAQGSDQVQGYKVCPNCMISDPTMVSGEENIWFLDTLKGSILELILPEKTLKEMKTVSFKNEFTKYILGSIALCGKEICLNYLLASYTF